MSTEWKEEVFFFSNVEENVEAERLIGRGNGAGRRRRRRRKKKGEERGGEDFREETPRKNELQTEGGVQRERGGPGDGVRD